MKKLKKQRSVIPVYLVAVVWLIAGFGVRIHRPLQFAVTIAISAAVFLLGRTVWRDRTIVINAKDPEPKPDKQEEKQAEPQQEAQPQPEQAKEPEQPQEPEDPEIAALRQERDRAVGEMRRLNDSIEDPVLSEQIDHIESTTGKIFAYVMSHPDQKGQIRRFLNYYLPVSYTHLDVYKRQAGRRLQQRRGPGPGPAGRGHLCPGGGEKAGVHHRRGAHAQHPRLQRPAEDPGGAPGAPDVHPGHHGAPQGLSLIHI